MRMNEEEQRQWDQFCQEQRQIIERHSRKNHSFRNSLLLTMALFIGAIPPQWMLLLGAPNHRNALFAALFIFAVLALLGIPWMAIHRRASNRSGVILGTLLGGTLLLGSAIVVFFVLAIGHIAM